MERKCEICGGELAFIHKGTRDNPDVNVYECAACHTKQLSLLVDNDYENGFMNGKSRMTEEDIQTRIKECLPDDIRRAEMVARWCEGRDVLDFGCGFGGFLNQTSHIAKSVAGVELGTDERSYLLSKGYDVKESIDGIDRQFEVVTMFHVFEHLNNPREWLLKINKKLTKNGMLFIEVPNSNDALLSLYESKAFADFTYWSAHLFLYSQISLTKLINEIESFVIEDEGQVQRYPLSNHLYWLSKGCPGGQNYWDFFDTEQISNEYTRILKEKGMCDTLFYRIRKK